MSIYKKRTFDNVISDIFNQNILGESKNQPKKTDSDYITFVIQEEEGGFVKSIKGTLKSIKQKDFEGALMYLHTASKSKKQDFEGFTELTNMFSNFLPKALKEIFKITSEIKDHLTKSKIKTNSLITREFYFEESETFGKNISSTIKLIMSNNFDQAKKSLEFALLQIRDKNKDDFNLKEFNSLINLIKVIDKVNRLRIVDVIDEINYKVEILIDVLKSYKKVNNDDKNILEKLKIRIEQIESRGVQDYLYEALKSHVARLIKSEAGNSVNTTILNKSIEAFESFLIQRGMVYKK